MKLFHVSDVHFGAEDPDAIAWFDACVADERPDAVIMTGDLTMRARRDEFARGAAWLTALRVPVTVEIGNHDIPYYSHPIGRIVRPYRRYLALERLIERPLALPGVTVVPLRTVARLQWRIDQSKGQVSRRSLAEALVAARAAPTGDLVFVAAHHPLVGKGPDGGTHGGTHGDTHGGAAALAALAEAGADAVLSGHVHTPFDLPYERGGRTVRLIGAGTLSRRTRGAPPSFNEIRIDADRRFETLVRSFSSSRDDDLREAGTLRAGIAADPL